jgi:hypothetical protein
MAQPLASTDATVAPLNTNCAERAVGRIEQRLRTLAVLDPLSVGPAVLGAVRSVARLGDLGVPGMFSHECGDGPCCSVFRDDLRAPMPASVDAMSVYSRSDGIVSWQACVDPYADNIEVQSSHTGMSVNADVYRLLAAALDREERQWTG